MPWILLSLLVLAVVFGPIVWAKAVLAWHGDDRPDLPGTGGELAAHLVERFECEPEGTVRESGVASPLLDWRGLQHEHLRAGETGRDGSGQRGVASADNDDVHGRLQL